MAVGVLLLTHEGIGSAMLAVATRLMQQLPLKTDVFEMPFDEDPDVALPRASAAMRRVDGGDGVLILTDLYGASPSNVVGASLNRLRLAGSARLPSQPSSFAMPVAIPSGVRSRQ